MNPVLLIVVPLILAFISIYLKPISKYLLLIGSLFNTTYLFFSETGVSNIGGFDYPYGISLLLDNYAFVALFFINVLFLLLIIINNKKIKEVAIVLLVALAGLNGLLLTHDLFNLFVFLEITGIAAYILTMQNKKLLASFQYLIIGSVGSGLYLLGLVILYVMVGTLNMTDVANQIQNLANKEVIMIPVLLMFIGLGVETKLLPFSSWVKGILQYATGLVGVLIASIYAGTMLFVFGRIFSHVFTFVNLPDTLVQVFVTIGIITLIAAEFAAFSSKKLREILLFSSIAQAGLIVILFIYGLSSLGMLMIISNVLSKFIMFTTAGILTENNENDDIDHLQGIFAKHKLLGFSFTVASLSLAGLPLFYGFLVKLNVLYNLATNNKIFVVVVILLTSIIEGAYLIRILVKLWNAGEEGEYANELTHITISKKPITTLIVLTLAIVIIVLGVYPNYAELLPNDPGNMNPLHLIEKWGGLK